MIFGLPLFLPFVSSTSFSPGTLRQCRVLPGATPFQLSGFVVMVCDWRVSGFTLQNSDLTFDTKGQFAHSLL